jgi:hypothetical protein
MVVGTATVVVGALVVVVGAVIGATTAVVGAIWGAAVTRVGGTTSTVVDALRRAVTGISTDWSHAPSRTIPEPMTHAPSR